MSKLFSISAAAAVMLAVPAIAADMPAKAPVYKAPAAVIAPSWTGFYIGINGGGAFGTTGASETGLPIGGAGASGDYNLDHHLSGWLAGGQLGYNWQTGRWVWGVEADFDGADIHGDGTQGGAGQAGNFVTAGEKIDYFGTLRGRVGGLVTDDFLLYATGGLAYGHIKTNGQFHYVGPVDYLASGSATKTGWAAGGGFEYRFLPQWTVKAEYLYYDLGKQTILSNFAFPGFQSQFDFNTHGSFVRAGLNYHF